MEEEQLRRRFVVQDAEAALMRTALVALMQHHPARDQVVASIEQIFAESQVLGAQEQLPQELREELRRQWPMFRALLDTRST